MLTRITVVDGDAVLPSADSGSPNGSKTLFLLGGVPSLGRFHLPPFTERSTSGWR